MAVLLIILGATVGLAFRARVNSRRRNVAGADTEGDSLLLDTCVRSFVVVLLSLLGLLVLGMTYGNVLGATAPT